MILIDGDTLSILSPFQSSVSFMSSVTPHILNAARLILRGGVIAYPTEGVYGLGCDPFNAEAVNRILDIKQRSVSKGLILIADDYSRFKPFIASLAPEQERTLSDSWPGPITWVVPHNGQLPEWITGGRSTVAIRVTSHPVASALCTEVKGPIVSTSANRHQQEALITQSSVEQLLSSDVDFIVPGQVLTPGKPSVIKDLVSGEHYRN